MAAIWSLNLRRTPQLGDFEPHPLRFDKLPATSLSQRPAAPLLDDTETRGNPIPPPNNASGHCRPEPGAQQVALRTALGHLILRVYTI